MAGEAQAVQALAELAKTRQAEISKQTEYNPTSKVGQFWKSIHPAVRNGLIVVGSGLTLFGLYKGYKYLNDLAQQRDEQKASDSAGSEYDKLIKQGKVLSKPQTDYRSAANLIEKLLDGCETSSSEFQVIENIIKVVKKPIDWLYLVKVFGVRKISDCGSFGSSKTEYDLATLLKDQLDTGGAYSIDVDGYKDSGYTSDSIEILRKYFSKIGVTI